MPERVVPVLLKLTGAPGAAGTIKPDDGTVVESAPNPVVPRSVTSKTNCSPIGCPINHGVGIRDTGTGVVSMAGETSPENEKP